MKLLAAFLSLLGLTMLGAAIFRPFGQADTPSMQHLSLRELQARHHLGADGAQTDGMPLVTPIEASPSAAACVSCGTNPYTTGGAFGVHTMPPIPECPEGQHLDLPCKDACFAQWHIDLDNALINAFAEWNARCADYQLCRAGCAAGDLGCKTYCDATWTAAQVTTFRNFQHNTDAADWLFLSCVSNCCVED